MREGSAGRNFAVDICGAIVYNADRLNKAWKGTSSRVGNAQKAAG